MWRVRVRVCVRVWCVYGCVRAPVCVCVCECECVCARAHAFVVVVVAVVEQLGDDSR